MKTVLLKKNETKKSTTFRNTQTFQPCGWTAEFKVVAIIYEHKLSIETKKKNKEK